VPAHDISPLLASVFFADFTSLLAVRLAVTEDSNRGVVVLITDSDPSNTVGYISASVYTTAVESLTVVPVISVFSVADCISLVSAASKWYSRKVLPASNEVLQLADGLLGVLTATSVHVTVEDTSEVSRDWQCHSRVTVYSEQDQGVCKGLEAGRDPSLKGLTDLSVVLHGQLHDW